MDKSQENIIKETLQPVVIEQQPTQQSSGFFHNLGEKIGLISPTPNETHFAKQPGLEQYPTYTTNYPTTINGAEHIDRINVEKPSIVERARDYMYGAGEWIGLVGNKDDKTWHEAAEHSAFDHNNPLTQDKLTEAGQKVGIVEKPMSEKAQDKLTETGQRVGLVEKPMSEKVQDKFTEAGQRIGLVEKPMSEKVQDNLTETGQNGIIDRLSGVGQKMVELVQKPAYVRPELEEEGQFGLYDKSMSEKAQDKLTEAGQKVGLVEKPMSEKAQDKLWEAEQKVDQGIENTKEKFYDTRDSTFDAAEQLKLNDPRSFSEKTKDYFYGLGERTGLVSSHPDLEIAKINQNQDTTTSSKKPLPA